MLKVLSPTSSTPTAASSATARAETPPAVLWIDAQDPTPQELEELARRFGWHHLSVEDVERPHQRAKIDRYETYRFLVVYAARYSGALDGLSLGELDIFLAPGYVVTVHKEPLPEIGEAHERWEARIAAGQDSAGALTILHAIVDAVVDGYFPVLDAIGGEVEKLEDRLFEGGQVDSHILRDALALRKQLLSLRRVIAPERDVLDHLLRSELLTDHPSLIVYYSDVHDHLIRQSESLDLQRDILTNLLEGYLSLVSNNLNQVMKTLTVAAIILMTLALVAGIYGMNFRNMPELEWRFGYFVVLGLMAAITAGLAWYFHRRGWL